MSTINDYRTAKETYLKLRDQAKKDLVAKFHALANELLQVQKELWEDFGIKVPIPSKPKGKPRKVVKPEPAKPAPRTAALEKRLAAAKQKLEQALATGKDTKTLKDRIYEIEDEIRLAKEKA